MKAVRPGRGDALVACSQATLPSRAYHPSSCWGVDSPSRHHAKQEENRGPEARTQVVPVWGWTQGTAQLISLAPGESRTGPADTPDSAVGNGKNPLLWGQTLQAPCLSVSGSIPWRSKWQPTPALLPGKSHGWRSLVGYSPWGPKESDMTEQLSMHTGKH